MEQNNSVKVNCDFCGKEIECPKDMLEKSKKHMCHECFLDKLEKGGNEPLKDVHVDFPINKLIPEVANNMTNEMVDEMFPKVWEERKHQLKEMSNKELAYEMFGAGAYIAINGMMQLQYQEEIKGKKGNANDNNSRK
ncbi:hypothetical protein HYW99_03915 [Candidatus Woesearchaeota archaeon]|nr:hypothetical protein [Candidatus Woesearchaeota archaeon]